MWQVGGVEAKAGGKADGLPKAPPTAVVTETHLHPLALD